MPVQEEIANKIDQIFKNINRDKYPYIACRLGHINNRFLSLKKVDYVGSVKYFL